MKTNRTYLLLVISILTLSGVAFQNCGDIGIGRGLDEPVIEEPINSEAPVPEAPVKDHGSGPGISVEAGRDVMTVPSEGQICQGIPCLYLQNGESRDYVLETAFPVRLLTIQITKKCLNANVVMEVFPLNNAAYIDGELMKYQVSTRSATYGKYMSPPQPQVQPGYVPAGTVFQVRVKGGEYNPQNCPGGNRFNLTMVYKE